MIHEVTSYPAWILRRPGNGLGWSIGDCVQGLQGMVFPEQGLLFSAFVHSRECSFDQLYGWAAVFF